MSISIFLLSACIISRIHIISKERKETEKGCDLIIYSIVFFFIKINLIVLSNRKWVANEMS